MVRNLGQPASIYEIAEFVKYAHRRAITPANIIAGFTKTGIYPFDHNVFSDEDFLSSAVSDRPTPDESGTYSDATPAHTGTLIPDSDATPARYWNTRSLIPMQRPLEPKHQILDSDVATGSTLEHQSIDSDATSGSHRNYRSPIPMRHRVELEHRSLIPMRHRVEPEHRSTGFDVTSTRTGTPMLQTLVSPQQFRGYTKAGKRKASSNGKQKGRSLIATATPERILLEAKTSKRKATITGKPKAQKKICVSKPTTNSNKSKQASNRQKLHHDNAVDTTPCSTCNMRFCDDKSGSKWAQCQTVTCQKWYHNACQGLEERNYKKFICIECEN